MQSESTEPRGPTKMLGDDRKPDHPAARQILGILAQGNYESASGARVRIAQEQSAAEEGTVLYSPERLAGLSMPSRESDPAVVEVRAATTQEASFELAREGDVCALNFASARNPGGGFFGGARAQEEELCRCSGLYRTLLHAEDYYLANRAEKSLLYTDHVIYSPRVPFFRVWSQDHFLEAPFLVSVITAPAPNAGAMARKRKNDSRHIEPTFDRRWEHVLAVAADQRQRRLVLGAWGCGAFLNEPEMVARRARRALKRFRSAFDHVVFAIPTFTRRSEANLKTFQRALG
ncbi:MAG: TIGR02452 family protein [Myxococcota bacterium]